MKTLGKQNIMRTTLATGLAFIFAACAPSAPQLRKVMEDNPDILYAAMKKDPAKFIDVVNEVAEAAKSQKEQQAVEEGFSKPLQAEIDNNRAMDGAKDAPITIVEYSDFQCPYCSKGHNTMNEVLAAYKGKVRVLFKNYPIERIHPQAMKLSKTYEAIATKNKEKALEFKNMVFTRQEEFNPNDAERKSKNQQEFMDKYNKRVDADLAKMVKSMGFDPAEIKKLGESEAVTKQITKDQEEAQKFGFSGTPGYLVNGVPVRGAYPVEHFKMVIDRVLAKNGGK